MGCLVSGIATSTRREVGGTENEYGIRTGLALAVLGAVAGVHDVAAGDAAKVAADGAGLRLQRVGGAHQLAEGGHHAVALPYL